MHHRHHAASRCRHCQNPTLLRQQQPAGNGDNQASFAPRSPSGGTASVQKNLSPKKEEKRYAHDFKKAIEESDRLNRSQTSTNSDDPTPTNQDEPTGVVTTHIDPDTSEQPTSSQVPTTRLGVLSTTRRSWAFSSRRRTMSSSLWTAGKTL